jgi:hypothetical protein
VTPEDQAAYDTFPRVVGNLTRFGGTLSPVALARHRAVVDRIAAAGCYTRPDGPVIPMGDREIGALRQLLDAAGTFHTACVAYSETVET